MRPAATALVLSCLAAGAPAQTLPSSEAVQEVRLIEGWRQDDGTHLAAIEIRLAPGWHTYWRVPGDAGIPPEIDWSASGNLAGVRYAWPSPTVFDRYGMRIFVYADTLVLPVLLTPKQADAPIEASANLFFGVCADLCLPVEAQLSARLSAEGPRQGADAISDALAARPLTAAEAGVTAIACNLQPGPDGTALSVEVRFASPPDRRVGLIEVDGLRLGRTETVSDGAQVTAVAHLDADAAALDRSRLRLTLLGGATAIEINGCRAPF